MNLFELLSSLDIQVINSKNDNISKLYGTDGKLLGVALANKVRFQPAETNSKFGRDH